MLDLSGHQRNAVVVRYLLPVTHRKGQTVSGTGLVNGEMGPTGWDVNGYLALWKGIAQYPAKERAISHSVASRDLDKHR